MANIWRLDLVSSREKSWPDAAICEVDYIAASHKLHCGLLGKT